MGGGRLVVQYTLVVYQGEVGRGCFLIVLLMEIVQVGREGGGAEWCVCVWGGGGLHGFLGLLHMEIVQVSQGMCLAGRCVGRGGGVGGSKVGGWVVQVGVSIDGLHAHTCMLTSSHLTRIVKQ